MKKLILFILLLSSTYAFPQTIQLHKIIDCADDQLSDRLRINKAGTWFEVYQQQFKVPNGYDIQDYFHQIIDYDQVVYQSCRSLNDKVWNDKRLDHFINRWGVDTLTCSANQINSFINGIITKKEGDSQLYYALDENNNLDFGDDPLYPIQKNIGRQHQIKFERFEGELIVEDQVQIHIESSLYDKKEKVVGFNYSYCEAREGNIQLEGQLVYFKINPGEWYSYHKAPKVKIIPEAGEIQNVSVGQYFELAGYYYQIERINKRGTALSIKKHPSPGKPYCNQIGYPAPPIMQNGKNVLEKYKGKNLYIYIYIWNIDCGACEMFLPGKYKAYSQKYGKKDSKIDFMMISVAKPEQHRKFMKKHDIQWPNIETQGNSKIFNDYGVDRFPTELLIDPEGKILQINAIDLSVLDEVK